MFSDLINLPYFLDIDDFLEKRKNLIHYLKKNKIPLFLRSKHQISGEENKKVYSPYYSQFDELYFQEKKYTFTSEVLNDPPSEFTLSDSERCFLVEISAADRIFSHVTSLIHLYRLIDHIISDLIQYCDSKDQDDCGLSKIEIKQLESFVFSDEKDYKTLPSKEIIDLTIKLVLIQLKANEDNSSIYYQFAKKSILKNIKKIEEEKNLIYFWNITNILSVYTHNDSGAIFGIELV